MAEAVRETPAFADFSELSTVHDELHVEILVLSVKRDAQSIQPYVLAASRAQSPLMPRVGISRHKHQLTRALATVADPPVRRYGGLKDQDRIFTNAYLKHDFGLKGALVRSSTLSLSSEGARPDGPPASLAEIGTKQKKSS